MTCQLATIRPLSPVYLPSEYVYIDAVKKLESSGLRAEINPPLNSDFHLISRKISADAGRITIEIKFKAENVEYKVSILDEINSPIFANSLSHLFNIVNYSIRKSTRFMDFERCIGFF